MREVTESDKDNHTMTEPSLTLHFIEVIRSTGGGGGGEREAAMRHGSWGNVVPEGSKKAR